VDVQTDGIIRFESLTASLKKRCAHTVLPSTAEFLVCNNFSHPTVFSILHAQKGVGGTRTHG